MIKEGDKIICIKTLYNKKYHKSMDNNRIIFHKGDVLYIEASPPVYHFRNKDLSIYATFDDSSNDTLWSLDEIRDYYMTMAEWREQQINSILDD